MDYLIATDVGEVLLKYFVNSDDSISFEVNQTLLYQKKKKGSEIWNLFLLLLQSFEISKICGDIP
jgi:hypothetical protein